MIKHIKKYKAMGCVICLLILISSIYFQIVVYTASKSNGITIVLDAGHGGRDGGCVGKNGSIEKDLNLLYVKTLKEELSNFGYKIVLTRKDDSGLYSPIAGNKKISDMNKRMQIIKEANPNLVVSIHMNSFSDQNVSGANCFYKIDDSASKNCANLIQKSLKEYCGVKNQSAKTGDYFMLNCSYYTSILIECGFLSNPDEEAKLITEEYRTKFSTAVARGILLYFGKSDNFVA